VANELNWKRRRNIRHWLNWKLNISGWPLYSLWPCGPAVQFSALFFLELVLWINVQVVHFLCVLYMSLLFIIGAGVVFILPHIFSLRTVHISSSTHPVIKCMLKSSSWNRLQGVFIIHGQLRPEICHLQLIPFEWRFSSHKR
jgi:hypothetical protein